MTTAKAGTRVSTTDAPVPGEQRNIFLDTIALPLLNFGHELKDGGVNARQADRAEVDTLAKSIRELGLIVPLTIISGGDARGERGKYYVVDGNRRLAALRSIYKGPVAADTMVPCYHGGAAGASAIELSMVANAERVDLHPVDRFEVFARLIAEGATVEALAARYMLKVPQVRQALALATMAPEVRDAWRAGKISAAAAEAYAQTQDLEHQRRILKKLGNRAGDAWDVKREIMGENGKSVDSLLKLVGADAYVAAGHHINESLFRDEDDHRGGTLVSSVPALRAMAEDRIAAEVEALTKAGWGWALDKRKAPADIGSWRRLPTSTPTKDQKAAAGCLVGTDYSGKIEITRGILKPGVTVKLPGGAKATAAAAKGAATRDESGGVSGALARELSRTLTYAAHDVMLDMPELALRVAVAAILTDRGQGVTPAKISTSGFHELDPDADETEADFAPTLNAMMKKTPAQLLAMLAELVARSLNLLHHSADSLPLSGKHAEPDEIALLDALHPKALNARMCKHFDYSGYFAAVASPMIRAAIKEVGGIAPPASAKKGDLVKMAVPLAKDKHWLPVELRSKGYDGPAAAKVKPDKAKGANTSKAKAKAKPRAKR